MLRIFPRDLLIFSLFIFTKPLCSQSRQMACLSPLHSVQSHFMVGDIRSLPPPCMSSVPPRNFWLMAEHSMCGSRSPFPHGLFHHGSPSLTPSAGQSQGGHFSLINLYLCPASSSSIFFPEKPSIFVKFPHRVIYITVHNIGNALINQRLHKSL